MSDITTKQVAILVDNYFEQSEFEQPLQTLKREGVPVTVVSTGEDTLQGMQHAETGETFMADTHIDAINFEDFDMLIVPGGAINADSLRIQPKAQAWIRYCMDNGISLAVICHAPWLLISAGVIDGLQITSYHTIQDDIVNAGGDWIDQELVIDGNVLSSRNPDDLPAFCSAIVEALEHDETAALI